MTFERGTNRLLFLFVTSIIFFGLLPYRVWAQEEWNTWFNYLMGITEPTISENPHASVRSQDEQKSLAGDKSILSKWLGISANLDYAYRNTNFYKSGHNTALFQGDSRLEFWMPPGRDRFSWGPYVRLAGLTSSRSEAWENAWLAQPGFGFNAYPFSSSEFKKENRAMAGILGPLRLFAEYNRLDYWGSENIWRPNEQVRVGADYWKQLNVNDLSKPTWREIWTGLIWQSANEFDKDYNTLTFGNALRLGFRKPDTGILSMITPYFAMESSLSENRSYYWDNRLLLGGGIRFAPHLKFLPSEWQANRFVIYAEYLGTAAYYRDSAPSSVPDHDFRIGISMSIGEWFR